MGLLNLLPVAHGLCLIENLDFLVGDGGDALGGHLDGVIVLVGAHQLNADVAVGGLGLNHQRGGVVVLELEVQGAPVDRGVAALLDVGDHIHMGLPLHDLEIGHQGAVVNRGRHLTDAAAHLGLAGAAVGIDDALLIALLGGALTDGPIEGEDLAGLEHRAVDFLAGQHQIGGTVGIIGIGAVEGGQHIGEVGLHIGVGGDLGLHDLQGDLDDGALLGQGQLLVGGGQIEAVAHDLLDDLLGLVVIVGILGRGTVFVVIGPQVHDVIGRQVVVEGDIGEVARMVRLEDLLIEPVRVQTAAGVAQLNPDDLVFLIHGDLRLDHLPLHVPGGLVDELADIRGVHLEKILQVQQIGGILAVEVCADDLEHAAVLAVGHGGLYHGGRVHGRIGHLRIEDQLAIRQLDRQRTGGVGSSQAALHSLQRLLRLHAPDIDAGHADIGEDLVTILEAQPPNQNTEKYRKGHGHHSNSGDHPALVLLKYADLNRDPSFWEYEAAHCLLSSIAEDTPSMQQHFRDIFVSVCNQPSGPWG